MRIPAKICDFIDSTRRREDMTFLALMILFPISMFGSVKPEVAGTSLEEDGNADSVHAIISPQQHFFVIVMMRKQPKHSSVCN